MCSCDYYSEEHIISICTMKIKTMLNRRMVSFVIGRLYTKERNKHVPGEHHKKATWEWRKIESWEHCFFKVPPTSSMDTTAGSQGSWRCRPMTAGTGAGADDSNTSDRSVVSLTFREPIAGQLQLLAADMRQNNFEFIMCMEMTNFSWRREMPMKKKRCTAWAIPQGHGVVTD